MMKEAYLFQDGQTAKFWAIEYSGLALCVHHGKTGTIGKYQIKEFETEEACTKEARKLIASKLKKGYQKDGAFSFDKCVYIDTEEYGPHRMTSHPRFVEAFTEDFYYDCGDEEAPFGSDEGSDTLRAVEERLRKNPALDFAAFPQYLVEKEWGMTYIPAGPLDKEAARAMERKLEMDMQQSDMVTYATAFAQIKTTGSLAPGLKERALAALKRNAVMYSGGTLTEEQQEMYDSLSRF